MINFPPSFQPSQFISMKKVLIVIGVLAAAIVVTGLSLDKEFRVVSEVSIKAPKEVVWEYISSLQKQNEWTPWSKKDPNITTEYTGKPGTIGSVYSWSGNSDVGQGVQEITAVTPMERVEQDLQIMSPWTNTADVFINLKEGPEGGSIVEWGFDSEHDFMSALTNLLLDFQGDLEKDYTEGLSTLKKLCEAVPYEKAPEPMVSLFTIDGVDIQNTEMMTSAYVGVRQEIPADKVQEFLSKTYKAISAELANAGYEPTGMPSALYFSKNEEAGTVDVAAAMPLGNSEVGLMGFESFTLDQGPAFVIDYHGGMKGLEAARNALMKGVTEQGVESLGPVVEEYIVDKSTEKNASKWHTRITLPIR